MRLPRLLTSPCVVQLNCPSVYQWVTLGPMVSYLEKGIAPDRTVEQMAIHPWALSATPEGHIARLATPRTRRAHSAGSHFAPCECGTASAPASTLAKLMRLAVADR